MCQHRLTPRSIRLAPKNLYTQYYIYSIYIYLLVSDGGSDLPLVLAHYCYYYLCETTTTTTMGIKSLGCETNLSPGA